MNMALRITLDTVDDRHGILEIAGDTDHEKPMEWDREGDGETTSVRFELFEDGKTTARFSIPGEAWRDLEDNGMLCYLWFWLKRGVRLSETVVACINGCDPDGWSSDDEQDKDSLRAEVVAQKGTIADLHAALQGLVDALSLDHNNDYVLDGADAMLVENAEAVLAKTPVEQLNHRNDAQEGTR